MRFNDILFGGFAIGMAIGSGQATLAQDQVIFFEDFNAPLDRALWQPLLGTGSQYGLNGWGNNELQFYRSENAWTENGNLVIEARRENFNGQPYTSARLVTRGAFDYTYGTVEASILIPSNVGIWPAFWMLPTGSPYGGWPASGEIDIMESFDFANFIKGTLHYGSPHTFFGGEIGGVNFAGEFVRYRVDWDPNEIRWYMNDQLYYTRRLDEWFSSSAPNNPRAPFDTPFHLILNVAVGGNAVGNPNQFDFPQRMLVDWVRVTQREQRPFTFIAPLIPGQIEAENFDRGYPGQAYVDMSIGNEFGAYRPDDDVDIEPASDGGFNVAQIEPGESIDYTVRVQEAGRYLVEASVASLTSASRFQLEFDGVNRTGPIETPVTGGWQDYVVVSGEADLEAGEQVMTFRPLQFVPQPFNVSWFRFTRLDEGCQADVNADGNLDGADFNAWLAAFAAGDTAADQNNDGQLNGADFNAWLAAFAAGC